VSVDQVYAERNFVVVAFARVAARLGWRVGVLEDPAEPDWPVLLVDTPKGQVSWHLTRKEADAAGFGRYDGAWDGHSTAEKYDRLRWLT
jgi:hypothetical protein